MCHVGEAHAGHIVHRLVDGKSRCHSPEHDAVTVGKTSSSGINTGIGLSVIGILHRDACGESAADLDRLFCAIVGIGSIREGDVAEVNRLLILVLVLATGSYGKADSNGQYK